MTWKANGHTGGGESGVGAAILAQEKGYDVFVSDAGSIKDKYKQELAAHEIEFEEGDIIQKQRSWMQMK